MVFSNSLHSYLNILGLGQNDLQFADNFLRLIFLYENCCIFIQISFDFVPEGPINNQPALVQIMVQHQTGNKPLPEPMMVKFIGIYVSLTLKMLE